MDIRWKTCSHEGCYRPDSRATEQCPLCKKMRKNFYCRNCVKNGDFIHSTSHFSERFCEKRLTVARIQIKKNDLVADCDKHIDKLRCRENKVEEIRLRKEKITMLQSLLKETRKKIDRKKKILESLKAFNRNGQENLERNEECKEDVIECTNNIINKRPALVDQLNQLKPQLKSLIRREIDEVVNIIFPITEVQSTKNSSLTSDSQEDIKNELAEATRTAYIRGRWVYTDSWGETQHSIVAPTLPASGDYSPYIHWVSANKDNVVAMTISSGVDHNAAYNINAALTFTTQLVNIIAYYLDIRLPNKLNFSEFCTKNLSEHRFIKCVTQLNANILMLCLSQNVDPHLLQPSRTIKNILLLLDRNHSDLGRLEAPDIASSCVSYLEEQLSSTLKAATTRVSVSDVEDEERDLAWAETMGNDDNDNEYDSDHISTDWEAVPLVACPEAMPGSNISRRQSTTPQTTSIAGGLVTSAATSLASFWRGWSINK